MLALVLPGMAAENHERRPRGEALARARVGANQKRDSLDLGVATDVEQDGAVAEGVEVLLAVCDRARLLARAPAARVVQEPLAPERDAIDPAPVEDLRVEAVRRDDDAVALDAEKLRD